MLGRVNGTRTFVPLAIAVASASSCMPPTAGGLAGGPPTLCTNMSGTSSPGNVLRCEDFGKVAEGTIPRGWSGGAGMMVKDDTDARRPVLKGVEPRAQYNLTVPWAFGGNYRLDLGIKGCSGLRVSVGHATLMFGTAAAASPDHLGIVRTRQAGAVDDHATAVTWAQVEPFHHSFWGMTLVREGDVLKVTMGSKQVLLARYEDLPDPEGITFTSTCPFAVSGIRVDGPPPRARAAAASPKASPPSSAPAPQVSPPAPSPPATAATGSIVVKADDNDARFAFEVDGKPVAGTFRAEPGKETKFTLPAGRLRWTHLESNCEEGSDAEREFDLRPGDKHSMECWTSNKMGVCCLFGGINGTPAPR